MQLARDARPLDGAGARPQPPQEEHVRQGGRDVPGQRFEEVNRSLEVVRVGGVEHVDPAPPLLGQAHVARHHRRERPRLGERLRQRYGVALQRPDARFGDANRERGAVKRLLRVPRAAGIVKQPGGLLRWIELHVQRPPRGSVGIGKLEAPQHRPARFEILDHEVDGGGVEDPQQLAADSRDRAAQPELHAGLTRCVGDGRNLGAQFLLLLGKIADETSGQHEVGDAQNCAIGRHVRPRKPRLVPRAGNARLEEKDPNRHCRRQDGLAESPAISRCKLHEEEEQEERAAGSAADKRQRCGPEDIDAVENLAIARREPGRPVHECEDDDAVQGIAEQHRIGQLRETCGLGRVNVDGDQPADGQKSAPDRKHALEACRRASLGSVIPKKTRRQ